MIYTGKELRLEMPLVVLARREAPRRGVRDSCKAGTRHGSVKLSASWRNGFKLQAQKPRVCRLGCYVRRQFRRKAMAGHGRPPPELHAAHTDGQGGRFPPFQPYDHTLTMEAAFPVGGLGKFHIDLNQLARLGRIVRRQRRKQPDEQSRAADVQRDGRQLGEILEGGSQAALAA